MIQKSTVLDIFHFCTSFLSSSVLLWCLGVGPCRPHLLESLASCLLGGIGQQRDQQEMAGRIEAGLFLPYSFRFHTISVVATVSTHYDSSPLPPIPMLTGFQLHISSPQPLNPGCGMASCFQPLSGARVHTSFILIWSQWPHPYKYAFY